MWRQLNGRSSGRVCGVERNTTECRWRGARKHGEAAKGAGETVLARASVDVEHLSRAVGIELDELIPVRRVGRKIQAAVEHRQMRGGGRSPSAVDFRQRSVGIEPEYAVIEACIKSIEVETAV